jgi:conserved oligomeric Golgi complex subunit 4
MGPKFKTNPRGLISLPDIMDCLSTYQSEEAELSNSLTRLISVREPVLGSLRRLQLSVHHIDALRDEASLLSANVSSTAQTAERIGERVRSLDEDMRRVREASDRVNQVLELKVTLDCFFSPHKSFIQLLCEYSRL